jgi:hypothetical protein
MGDVGSRLWGRAAGQCQDQAEADKKVAHGGELSAGAWKGQGFFATPTSAGLSSRSLIV